MIKRVLFLLFNVDAVPRYKTRPDLKDCEYVLGYFCEQLIRRSSFTFSRDQFLFEVQEFCKERLIDMDISVVFDVLFENSIIVAHGSHFSFKFAYWISYFVAQRMHHEPAFAHYVFSEMRYATLHEVVEFYTGIDRQKADAIRVITTDLREVIEKVRGVCGIPVNLNPYRLAVWKSSTNAREEMANEIASGVKDSNLPVEIKDRYADRDYDRTRPYNQQVGGVLSDKSVSCLLHTLRSAARALRNSDYVSPEQKRELLAAILEGWEEISRVVMVVIPLLAATGRARVQGASFVLSRGFDDTESPGDRVSEILSCVPTNIVGWYKDDLYSQKMAPLLFESVQSNAIGEIARHELILLLASARPRGWGKIVQNYMATVRKDSFYLLDLYKSLRTQYRYGYMTDSTLQEMEHLIRLAATKHVTGEKLPGTRSIAKQKFRTEVVPPREKRKD
jgi:hypothetical protein